MARKPHKTRKSRKKITKGETCSVHGCNRPITARGLCFMHYQNKRDQGTLPPDEEELLNPKQPPCTAPHCVLYASQISLQSGRQFCMKHEIEFRQGQEEKINSTPPTS